MIWRGGKEGGKGCRTIEGGNKVFLHSFKKFVMGIAFLVVGIGIPKLDFVLRLSRNSGEDFCYIHTDFSINILPFVSITLTHNNYFRMYFQTMFCF